MKSQIEQCKSILNSANALNTSPGAIISTINQIFGNEKSIKFNLSIEECKILAKESIFSLASIKHWFCDN